MNKILGLIALVVAITSFGIDPSHARRIRFSFPAAKAAPASAVKPAPVAAARTPATNHLVIMPGVAIRPAYGAAPAAAPVAASAPLPDDPLLADIVPITPPQASAPVMGAASDQAVKREEPAAPPAQQRSAELTSPQPQRGTAPPPAGPPVLCWKTADGRCGRIE